VVAVGRTLFDSRRWCRALAEAKLLAGIPTITNRDHCNFRREDSGQAYCGV